MNKSLSWGSQAYYLKAQLKEIKIPPNKQKAEKVMLDWGKQLRCSNVYSLAAKNPHASIMSADLLGQYHKDLWSKV